YYFSGTGNSYAAAKFLADGLGEDLMDIAAAVKEHRYEYKLAEGERLGFVFPVYAWAPPKMVTDFVKNLELYYSGDPYLFAVCTCGASAGKTMDIFEKALEENGLVLDSGFSVVMPDNCITLFEVDSEEEISEKFEKAEKTLDHILRAINLGWSDFFRVKRGRLSGILSGIMNPVFSMGALKTKPFYVTNDCISCGLCAKNCTSGCIEMTAGKPVWTEDKCNMCLACINRCPVKAIQYGKKTAKRGRYVHPIYQTEKNGEMTE
ncbi:MAG: EFR1 family ferrodoxin, partial [Anaerotignum sp.]|nr:EFR1 family ferrodoxin [Anaerotignum sp.]